MIEVEIASTGQREGALAKDKKPDTKCLLSVISIKNVQYQRETVDFVMERRSSDLHSCFRNVACSFNTPSQKVNRKGKLSLIEK